MESVSLGPSLAVQGEGLRFQALFDAVPDSVLIVDAKGLIVEVNAHAVCAFGYPAAELLGQPVEMLVPEALREGHRRLKDDFLKRPEMRAMGVGLNLEARRRDGSTFPVDINLGPLDTPAGRHVIAIVRDMSERRFAESEPSRRAVALDAARGALKARNAMLSSILESMGEAVVVVDRTGRMVLVNSEARRLHAMELSEDEPQAWPERHGLFTPDGARRLEAREVPLYRALHGEHVDDYEVLVRAPGRQHGTLVTTTARPLLGDDGTPQGAVVVFRDISERKRSEQENERRAHELTHANAELEAFAYSVSHDLRTPLRAMQGLGLALEEDFADQLPPQGRDFLQRIVSAAKRMDTLILDLLAYSRVGRGQSMHRVVDLDLVWRAATADLSPDQKGSVLLCEPLGRVWGNPSMLEQIAANLLANALKFVGPGVLPRVEVHSQMTAGRVRVSVQDNGIGIDSSHHARIFGIFERLHGVEQYPGTGIGLALVKKATEGMNGSVGVQSQAGSGSCFWFELERAEVE